MSPKSYLQDNLTMSDGLRICELIILVATIVWGASEVRVMAAALERIAQDTKEIRAVAESNESNIREIDTEVSILKDRVGRYPPQTDRARGGSPSPKQSYGTSR